MTAAFDPGQLRLGDATDASLFDEGQFHLTVTSPPYNVGLRYGDAVDDATSYADYLEFSRQWLANVYRWSVVGGRLCLNIPLDKNSGGKQAVTADLTNIAREVGWKYHATIIWNEGNISRRTAWGSWMRPSAPHIIAPVETIVVLYKGEWKRTHAGDELVTITRDEFMSWTSGTWRHESGEGTSLASEPSESEARITPDLLWELAAAFQNQSTISPAEFQAKFRELLTREPTPALRSVSVGIPEEWLSQLWTFGGESAKRIGHPAPFPLELPRRCIRLLSYVGDQVLDPFAGSGTTLVAALQDRRHAYGIELNADYRELALGRINAEVPRF